MPPRYQIGVVRCIKNLTPLSRTLSPDCPAGGSGGGCCPAGGCDKTHQEADLVPTPYDQAAGEGGEGSGDAGVLCACRQAVEADCGQDGGAGQAPAEGAGGQAVQPDDQPGAKRPEEQGVEPGEVVVGHGRPLRFYQAGASRTSFGNSFERTGSM